LGEGELIGLIFSAPGMEVESVSACAAFEGLHITGAHEVRKPTFFRLDPPDIGRTAAFAGQPFLPAIGSAG
jgi:hypothetical protein